MLCGRDGDVVGSEDIVFDGLKCMSFHQWNVLVSRGMIDHSRFIMPEDFVQAIAVLNASDFRVERNKGKGLTHFAIDLEEGRFRNLKSDNPGRVETRNLPAKFETDRSGRAGDENDFSFQRAPD